MLWGWTVLFLVNSSFLVSHHRIQLDYLKKEAAAGRLPAWAPPEAEPARSLLETVGVPAFTQIYHQDPELALATSMSKSMWTSNPGAAS